jgi:large subunit ribosomal protein L4
MKVSVYNKEGQETDKKVELSEDIFGIEPNDHAIYLDCKQYLANNRQGTHKSKERGEVKGSTKKIKKQKGTGTARAGDIKNPLFKGGGRVFGPTPRDYSFKLNKKLKRLARKSALSYKAKNNEIFVIDDFNFEAIKTKNVTNLLNNFKLINKKMLLVVGNQNKTLYLSSRNLQGVQVINANELSTYDVIKASVLIIEENAIDVFENVLA